MVASSNISHSKDTCSCKLNLFYLHFLYFQRVAVSLWNHMSPATPDRHARSADLLHQLHNATPDAYICEDIIGNSLVQSSTVKALTHRGWGVKTSYLKILKFQWQLRISCILLLWQWWQTHFVWKQSPFFCREFILDKRQLLLMSLLLNRAFSKLSSKCLNFKR